MRLAIMVLLLLPFGISQTPAQTMLVPRGSVWKYYYNGEVATNWPVAAFDDRLWPSGPAQIGYGEGDEQTVAIDDPGFEPTTLYFRRFFAVTNASTLLYLTLRIVADDAAVVYLNGDELWRMNMPEGPVNYFTWAKTNIETNENSFVQFGVPATLLRSGTNILGVEVHQHFENAGDCSFDLELLANVPAEIPSIRITSPADGTRLPAGDVLIQTVSSDQDGHVARVVFFTNGVVAGEVQSEPFSFTWANPAPGRYALTVRAYDELAGHGNSQIVHVQVGDVEAPIKLVRGPYLQRGSPTNMVVRWRTDWLSESLVRYGTNSGNLDRALTNLTQGTEQEMNVSGLLPDTKYYYSAGTLTNTLASGGDVYFRTSPTNARPLRMWIIGDSGTGDANARAVRDSYYAVSGAQETDLWLMLGDNAYGEGSDAEYQTAVFEMYPQLLRKVVLWPTLGNHDAGDTLTGTAGPYLDIFNLPSNGEAGGVPSGSEFYYSFDYANIHLICLDSFLADRSSNGPMVTWLRSDLAATDKDWIIAFWHHPPYSFGSHNSDSDEFETQMRKWVLPVLEEFGVDLVFSGHSHNYERSFLIDGHYGYSWELQSTMVLDNSLGQIERGGAYKKPAGGLGARRGAVYSVCGCSGEGGELNVEPHPVMASAHGGYGSVIVEIDGLQLNARFLRPSQEIDDHFSIDKSGPTTVGPTLQIAAGIKSAVLSWPTSKPEFALDWKDHVQNEWSAWTGPTATTHGRRNVLRVDAVLTNRFFRLRSPP